MDYSTTTLTATPASDLTGNKTSYGHVEVLDSEWLGYLCLLVTVLMFGTNFVPVKKVRCGDGVYFQFIMCTAVMLVAVALGACRGFPKIYPMAMLSGCIWATANLATVIIVNCIGLGLGTLLWSSSSMVNGWASGRFGWFGLKAQVPANPALNYAGVSLALVSTFLFVFVKPTVPNTSTNDSTVHTILVESSSGVETSDSDKLDEETPLIQRKDADTVTDDDHESPIIQWIQSLSPVSKRFLGVFLAIGSGCLYGQQFTSVIYIIDHPEIYPGAPTHGFDYLLTNYIGIYITGSVWFVLYCLVFRSRIYVKKEIILPGITSGVMWAIGQATYLITVQNLSQAVSYPVCTSLTSLINALLGVFIFREITGVKNLLVLTVAATLIIAGATFNGLSRT